MAKRAEPPPDGWCWVRYRDHKNRLIECPARVSRNGEIVLVTPALGPSFARLIGTGRFQIPGCGTVRGLAFGPRIEEADF